MGRQIGRLEDVDIDGCSAGSEYQGRVVKTGAPTGIDERSVNLALRPGAVEPVELVMVRTTRSEGSIRRQAVRGARGNTSGHAVRIHVSHSIVGSDRTGPIPTWILSSGGDAAAATDPSFDPQWEGD
jgi:hypothetical protein